MTEKADAELEQLDDAPTDQTEPFDATAEPTVEGDETEQRTVQGDETEQRTVEGDEAEQRTVEGDEADGADPTSEHGEGDGADGVFHAVDEPEVPTYLRFDCTGDAIAEGADAARDAVERGECVVLPTDTVYGIGVDAFSPDAVQRLLDAKGRGRDMPPPVLIADAGLIRAFSSEVPQAATDLMAKHWPGALTVILPALSSLTVDLGDTDGTIALRVPDHPLARDLLRRTGPLAVSSANRTGEPAALTVDEAIHMLGNAVSVYLDGGTLGASDPLPGARSSLPSTMVDFTRSEHGQVLRVGAISLETLRETVPGIAGPPRLKTVDTAADISAAINAAAEQPVPADDPAHPETAPDDDPAHPETAPDDETGTVPQTQPETDRPAQEPPASNA